MQGGREGMKRRQRTEILVEGSRELAARMAQAIADRYEVKLVEQPSQGLVMVKVRETAKRSLFYLGEVLVSECKVQVEGSMGIGVVKGHDHELAYQLALIDAAYQAGLQETRAWDQMLLDEEARIAAARSQAFAEIAKTKRAYRKVVDSMSRPGLISDLTAEAAKADAQWGGLPVTWVLALMLLDTEVTFCICSQREAELTRLLNQLTFAARTEPEKADYIFVLHDANEGDLLKALQGAKVGTLADPHASATVIVESGELSGDFELSLKGPGIEDESFVRIPLAPAVKGGTLAIEESLKRIKFERIKQGKVLDVARIEGGMRGLIDQIMSESSLYDETLAALAIKQAEGSPEEAVFLLRAYRSTLPRKHYSRAVHTREMRVERRISGRANSRRFDAARWLEAFAGERGSLPEAGCPPELMKVMDYLIEQGLMISPVDDNTEPDDVTRRSITFPASRSQKLQVLTRGQIGTVTSLAYAVIRGYGVSHPTVGELRVGRVPVCIDDPLGSGADAEDSYYIGEIKVTEAEMLMSAAVVKEQGGKELSFEIGYGLCYGQNETKAIAMGILDHSLEQGDSRFPTQDQEFVLYHIDSVESTGFMSHLKLPHYVTFQSKMNDVRKTKTTATTPEAEETKEVEELCK
ncbi:hypothetical protein BGX30_003388 [Mortierella sp. GBA39]|nr:hypothetical protein BGX30_003388 [Mortierella sp. GBA39]